MRSNLPQFPRRIIVSSKPPTDHRVTAVISAIQHEIEVNAMSLLAMQETQEFHQHDEATLKQYQDSELSFEHYGDGLQFALDVIHKTFGLEVQS